MDQMVLLTQQWLNATYGDDSRFNRVTEDGITGWGTIYALTRALQIELGITATADNFGTTTKNLFASRFPSGVQQQAADDVSTDNIYAIIQGALWCKGYSTRATSITCHFYSGTAAGIKELKADAGVDSTNANVTTDVMQALLSMNQYVTLWRYGGTATIREIQQQVNASYRSYVGLSPCDGLYGRDMNKALIKVLQVVEGQTGSNVDGVIGTNTKNKCPILPSGANVTTSNKASAIKLFKYALNCNGFATADLTGTWDDELTSVVKAFQKEYALEETGIGDLNTWMALLLSKGNTARSAVGCDCSTILDAAKATALYNAGYRYVGRYLTGTVGGTTSKALTRNEMATIFAAGLRVFAIYQDNDPSVGYYTKSQGEADALIAIQAAKSLGIPYREYIYFAVDYDFTDANIKSNGVPYFEGIKKVIKSYRNMYKIGVYGSRNVCQKICDRGLADSSFVADMSSGFSGNMGYPLPDNWAFDQFYEYSFSYTNGSFALDKDAVSGRYTGFNTLEEHTDDSLFGMPAEDIYMERYKAIVAPFNWYGGTGTLGLDFNSEKVLDLPSVEITYRVGNTVNIVADNEDCTYVSCDITDGSVDAEVVTMTKAVFNDLSVSQQMEFSDGNLEMLSSLEKEIQNGSIRYGIGMDLEGNLILDYQFEELLWVEDSVEYILYGQVTMKIRKQDKYATQMEQLALALNPMTQSEQTGKLRLATDSAMGASTGAAILLLLFILFGIA